MVAEAAGIHGIAADAFGIRGWRLLLREKQRPRFGGVLLVGGAIRRLQQEAAGETKQKYSFLFHTEQSRESHDWQQQVTEAIRTGLVELAKHGKPGIIRLIEESWSDLKNSVEADGGLIPELKTVEAMALKSLVDGHLMITTVNSNREIEEMLDDDGQLKLRTPLNLYIGGQILDRGITIRNLIGFYYGRNPQKFQQDTVLQHARMYGARPKGDLPVTRFYAPLHIYQLLRKIHQFDAALRKAFESGSHDKGVYFIQRSLSDKLIPCSPNKLLFSRITTVTPGERFLPRGFQTVYKTNGRKNLEALDAMIAEVTGGSPGKPVLTPVETAVEMLRLAYENLEFDSDEEDERRAHIAILEHLSRAAHVKDSGKVWLITNAEDRKVSRVRPDGRYQDSPDTKQQRDMASKLGRDLPILILLRQGGAEERGWRGLPFWWPVVVTPFSAVTSVFADEVPADAGAVTA